ncbi:MAG TPA: hypothetical protein VG184_11300 [Acidimicrobiales bacterium]|nr:hypothetical protein [Acidimicrobiales bacterium]
MPLNAWAAATAMSGTSAGWAWRMARRIDPTPSDVPSVMDRA